MKPNLLNMLVALIGLGPACVIDAAENDSAVSAKRGEQVAQIQKILTETLVDTRDFPDEMSLVQFLAAMETKLPEDKKISLKIDQEALGKQSPKVASTTIKPLHAKNVSFATVLRRVLSQVSGLVEVDYGIQPSGVVITRPRMAAHAVLYDIRGAVLQMPSLLPGLKEQDAETYKDVRTDDGPALLVRFLMNGVEMREWETMQVLNRTRLEVLASPTRHEQIANLMEALSRMSDVAVVMNARLYEVDRSWYAKHVAPLFAPDKDSDDRPIVLSIDAPLFKRIAQQKLLLESDDIKIRPNQHTTFLSQESVFRFAAGRRQDQEERLQIANMSDKLTGTGMAGVAFQVFPRISADRRYLRLQVTQTAAQLVGIDKTKTLETTSGKEVEVESPNVRKTSATGTVQIEDAAPLLMPVSYRPPGKEGDAKVWLLVARPFIWIEEEVKEIRREGGDVSPKAIWESEVQEKEKTAPATPVPFNDDVKEILQAIVSDVLTNPDLKGTREFYGTKKDKTFTLADNAKLGWPKEFKPDTHGHKLVEVPQDPFVSQRRVLGLRLDKFDLKQKKTAVFDAPIEVCLVNAGGNANGAVIGGCTVYYVPKRVGKRWMVECTGGLDP